MTEVMRKPPIVFAQRRALEKKKKIKEKKGRGRLEFPGEEEGERERAAAPTSILMTTRWKGSRTERKVTPASVEAKMIPPELSTTGVSAVRITCRFTATEMSVGRVLGILQSFHCENFPVLRNRLSALWKAFMDWLSWVDTLGGLMYSPQGLDAPGRTGTPQRGRDPLTGIRAQRDLQPPDHIQGDETKDAYL
ncbi:hypothetical protein CRUP_023881 [Coryphaenoides rupestris]|nr:hypothetical protein CRUP_023881 [Coryphaenoides rupestris]